MSPANEFSALGLLASMDLTLPLDQIGCMNLEVLSMTSWLLIEDYTLLRRGSIKECQHAQCCQFAPFVVWA